MMPEDGYFPEGEEGDFPPEESGREYWNDMPDWLKESDPADCWDEDLRPIVDGEDGWMEEGGGIEPEASFSAEHSVYDHLNPEQREAADVIDGACLVTAGPGTGKTRTITGRIEHLARCGKRPSRILAMTFTKKAAKELKERLEKVSPVFAQVRAGTFHSVAIAILREELGGNRVIPYDDREERECMAELFLSRFNLKDRKEIPFDDDGIIHDFYRANHETGAKGPGEVPKAFHALMKMARIPDRVPDDWCGDEDERARADGEFYDRLARILPGSAYEGLGAEKALFAFFADFNRYKAENCIYSFDDCIVAATRILNGPNGAKYRGRYDYVSVDEFQDTDVRQTEMVRGLVRDHGNIFAVGDARQAIYAWRGAYARVFDDFRESYRPREIQLVRNYRSTDSILAAVNTAAKIRRDGERDSDLMGRGDRGAHVSLDEPWEYEPQDAAMKIARKIGSSDEPLSEIAVLVRSHGKGASMDLQAALARMEIPFEVVGGMKMSDRVLFKNLRHVMRLVENPAGALPWQALAGQFPGIGKAMAAQVAQVATMAAKEAEGGNGIARAVATLRASRQKTELANAGKEVFCDFMERLAGFDGKSDPLEIIREAAGPLSVFYMGVPMRQALRLPARILDGERYERLDRGFSQEIIDSLRDLGKAVGAQAQAPGLKEAERKRLKKERDAVEGGALACARQFDFCVGTVKYAAAFCHNARTPGKWLDNLAFDEPGRDDGPKERVTVSTIHSAKGREWGEVHVPDLADGLFPAWPLVKKVETEAARMDVEFKDAALQDTSWQEEKNLLYVALSRAKRSLFLYSAESRQSPLMAELMQANARTGAIRKKDGSVWGAAERAGARHGR